MAMEEYLKAVKNPYLAKLLEEGMSTTPIQSHWQGAARLAQGLLGGLELGRQDASQAAMDKGFADLLKQAQGGYEQPSPSATPAPQMPAPRVTTAGQPIGPTAANPYGRPGGAVASSPTVMGDAEARAAGLYEEPKGVPQVAPASFAQRFQPPAPAGANPVQSVPQAPQMTQLGRPGVDPTTAAIAQLLYRGGHGAEALKALIPGELKSQDLGDSIVLTDKTGRPIAQYSKSVINVERQKQQAETEFAGPKKEATEAAELKYAGPKARAVEVAKGRGEAELGLPSAEVTQKTALKNIEDVRNHPGRNDWFASGTSSVIPPVYGTRAYDYKIAVNQLKGGSFLQAYQLLKGGGAIANKEGDKAEAAVARLDRAQTKGAFDKALDDYRDAITSGFAALQEKAGAPKSPQSSGGGGEIRWERGPNGLPRRVQQ